MSGYLHENRYKDGASLLQSQQSQELFKLISRVCNYLRVFAHSQLSVRQQNVLWIVLSVLCKQQLDS